MLENSITNTSWGADYTENVVVPLDNFISRATDVFCTSTAPNYRESVFRIVKHCFHHDSMEEEISRITKVLDIVLLNCRGRVDEWVWPYIELCMEKIKTVMNAGFATLLMNVVAAALVYNVNLTLQALEAHGRTTEVCC